jgi:hypothetical protein
MANKGNMRSVLLIGIPILLSLGLLFAYETHRRGVFFVQIVFTLFGMFMLWQTTRGKSSN